MSGTMQDPGGTVVKNTEMLSALGVLRRVLSGYGAVLYYVPTIGVEDC